MSASLGSEAADQSVAGHRRQAGCSGGQCRAPSPLPSAPPPAHCQPGGGAYGEQPDEPGPAALHDGDDPPQPHRDQEQADAASQQTARRRTPRIAHHHHLLEDCAGGTCHATADSSQGLLTGTDSGFISVVTSAATAHCCRALTAGLIGRSSRGRTKARNVSCFSRCCLHRLRPLRCLGRSLGLCLVHPFAIPRHGKARDADI